MKAENSLQAGVSGVLPVNKPKGIVSKDVSRELCRRFGRLKLGHVGTLDPEASGVLPVLVGSATKIQDYLLGHPKSYEFSVEFGTETDTLDMEGAVLSSGGRVPTAGEVEAVLPRFSGEITQEPPLFSAVKYKGKALYEYARSAASLTGGQPPLAELSRKVQVHWLRLLSFDAPTARFEVRCGKGTYVRSLARDIAHAVGTVAVVSSILRTESSSLRLEQTVALDDVLAGKLDDYLIPLESVDLGLPRLIVTENAVIERLKNGQKLKVSSSFFEPSLKTLEISERPCFSDSIALYEQGKGLFGVGDCRQAGEASIVSVKRGLWK